MALFLVLVLVYLSATLRGGLWLRDPGPLVFIEALLGPGREQSMIDLLSIYCTGWKCSPTFPFSWVLGILIFLGVLLMESTEPHSLKLNSAAWTVRSASATLHILIHPQAGASKFTSTITRGLLVWAESRVGAWREGGQLTWAHVWPAAPFYHAMPQQRHLLLCSKRAAWACGWPGTLRVTGLRMGPWHRAPHSPVPLGAVSSPLRVSASLFINSKPIKSSPCLWRGVRIPSLTQLFILSAASHHLLTVFQVACLVAY